jgi:hypothetical protein
MPEKPESLVANIAREFAERIETVNLPVVRASSVLFQSLDEIERIAKGVAAGEKHVSSYATVGTPITFALIGLITSGSPTLGACAGAYSERSAFVPAIGAGHWIAGLAVH